MAKDQMVALSFSKMHGIGNDFVIIDAREQLLSLAATAIAAMADRRRGIGFDQLISIEPPRQAGHLAYYGIWNADGSPAGQCGNGARCVAAWLHRAGALALDTPVWLESPAGPVQMRMLAAERVEVVMGQPLFAPAQIPMQATDEALAYTLALAEGEFEVGAVSMGNPHVVLEVIDLEDPRLARLGPALTTHPQFPAQANAGFVRVIDAGHVALRVHERGSGWTQACGTGACAAVAVLRRRGRLAGQVQVDLPGGRLQIDWQGAGAPLRMSGPAAFAFEGVWGRSGIGQAPSCPPTLNNTKRLEGAPDDDRA